MKLAQLLLAPWALLYGLGVGLRNWAYNCGWLKIHRIGAPVISIGNLTTGGTGKTTMTLTLAKRLQLLPYHLSPAILSRGYRRKSHSYQLVSAGQEALCDWRTSGDEPQLFAQQLLGVPVAVDVDRVQGGSYLIEQFHPSVILLDDGFQHRRLHRDLDIVLLDSQRNLADQTLLPAGRLREPLSSLRRADLIVLIHYQDEQPQCQSAWSFCKQVFGEKKLVACRNRATRAFELRSGGEIPLSDLTHKLLIPFCGLAKPESFAQSLEQLGVAFPYFIRFPDHHVYRPKDAEKLATAFTQTRAEALITTPKDAVKLNGLFKALPIWVLNVEIEWLRGVENLDRELRRLFPESSCSDATVLP